MALKSILGRVCKLFKGVCETGLCGLSIPYEECIWPGGHTIGVCKHFRGMCATSLWAVCIPYEECVWP